MTSNEYHYRRMILREVEESLMEYFRHDGNIAASLKSYFDAEWAKLDAMEAELA